MVVTLTLAYKYEVGGSAITIAIMPRVTVALVTLYLIVFAEAFSWPPIPIYKSDVLEGHERIRSGIRTGSLLYYPKPTVMHKLVSSSLIR